ncbi:DUF6682 family protein [Cereibacter sphaeroides f. sp. denitrificans]|nr:hypothetical protein DWF04_06065 [Cereibacter sphaeroides f. sp. denitrificans]
MSFQAKDVMKAASTTLQDGGAIRWTPPELLEYLNAGMREIVTRKPNAVSETRELTLVQGTKQELPADCTILADVTYNTVAPKTAIRALANRTLMDAQIPGWQDTDTLPFNKTVRHVIHSMNDPRSFHVVPGNDGTGKIEAVVGVMPAPVAAPAGAAALDIDAYTNTVPMQDVWRNALENFVLYRAFSKDAGLPGAGERAAAHFQMFTTIIEGVANGEAAMALANQAKMPA